MVIINIPIFSCLEVRTESGGGLRQKSALPSKYKDLNPRTHVKTWSMVLCVCNPTTGEVEAEDHVTLARQLVQPNCRASGQ